MGTNVKSPRKTVKRTVEALRHVRRDASAENVHTLRTGLRRIEALTGRALPRQVKKVRKQAGEVRDLDVFRQMLDEMATQPGFAGAAECVRSRIESQRRKRVRRLTKAAKKFSAGKLRRWSKRHDHAPAKPGDLLQDLRNLGDDPAFTEVTAQNLHDLRLKIKPIRYRAETLEGDDARKVEQLCNDAQAAIGRWHDELLLLAFAEDVLKQPEHPMLEALRQRCERDFEGCRTKVSELLQRARQPRPPAIAIVRSVA
jgi:CHAD domain-containing protein